MKAHTSRAADPLFGECRLCRIPVQLRHSHVIPRLMFRPMARLAPGTPMRVDSREGRSRPGHLKESMLCPRCEEQFSAHERIAARFLADLNQCQLRAREPKIRRSYLDYANLKLFFLSVLWRCAVARDPMTSQVDLGPRLPRLTALLRASDPGGQEEIPGPPPPARRVTDGEERRFDCPRTDARRLPPRVRHGRNRRRNFLGSRSTRSTPRERPLGTPRGWHVAYRSDLGASLVPLAPVGHQIPRAGST